MRFKIKVKNEIHEWWKEYDRPFVTDLKSAKKWASDTVAFFNCTLRPGEKRRKVLEVCLTTDDAKADSAYKPLQHEWEKVSLVTEAGGYDRMRCSRCGVEGKRYGLGVGSVHPDSRNSKMRDCNYAYQKLVLKKKRVVMKNASRGSN